MAEQKVVLVTGAKGLLGSAVVAELHKQGGLQVMALSRQDGDLRDKNQVDEIFRRHRPQYVLHCAARVGGIGANKTYPVEFLNENLAIQNNVINAAFEHDVDRLIFFASNAIYPAIAERPLSEKDILGGPPEATVRPYAIAKIAGVELCHAYNQQHGKQFLSLIPVNLYGPRDNFDLRTSHVLPALIRKFHEAKVKGEEQVEVWGSGMQRREFMCSLDLARIAIEVLNLETERFQALCQSYPPMVNIGAGADISIRELAALVQRAVGYAGQIVFNTDRPEGIARKQTDITKMRSLGLTTSISLEEGIKLAYQYFLTEAK